MPFPLWLPEHSLSSHGWTNLMQHGASPQSESQMECRCGPSTGLIQSLQILFPFMCVITYMSTCLYMCVHAFVLFMYTYMHVNVCLCSCLYGYGYIHMSAHFCVYVRVYVCTITGHTYIHITTIQSLQFYFFLFPFTAELHFLLSQTPHLWQPLFFPAYPNPIISTLT